MSKIKAKFTREHIEDLKQHFGVNSDFLEVLEKHLKEELKSESQKVCELREKKLERIMKKKNNE